MLALSALLQTNHLSDPVFVLACLVAAVYGFLIMLFIDLERPLQYQLRVFAFLAVETSFWVLGAAVNAADFAMELMEWSGGAFLLGGTAALLKDARPVRHFGSWLLLKIDHWLEKKQKE